MNIFNYISSLMQRFHYYSTSPEQEVSLNSSSNIHLQMPEEDIEMASTVSHLKQMLHDRNEELKRRDEMIVLLERELDEKDALIRHLRNEIDKFRQVVRPLTQQIITQQRNSNNNNIPEEFWVGGSTGLLPGVENTRVIPVAEPRIKRQAISAEPLSQINGANGELQIVKIPKTQR